MNILKKLIESSKALFYYVLHNKKLWLLPAFVVFLLLNFVFSSHGIINRIKLELEQDELLDKISIEKHNTDSLKQRILTLTYDSLEIERLAREYYGMLKQGEKLYIYKQTEKKEE